MTAIEQLIEKKQQKLDSLMGNPNLSVKVKVQINAIKCDLQMLEKMLPIEKQQMKEICVWFQSTDNSYKSYDTIVEEYYQNTFKK